MSRSTRFAFFAACLLPLALSLTVVAQQSAKKRVSSQDDLPRFTYRMAKPASDLVQADDATFNDFSGKVRSDMEKILQDFEIQDKATLRLLLSARFDLQQLAGENQAALETLKSLRALEEKPAARLTAGLLQQSILQAASETKSTSGPAFEAAFTRSYREAIDPLPWDVVRDSVRSELAQSQLATKAALIGYVKTEIDPAVEKSGALDNLQAWTLIDIRSTLQFEVPLASSRVEILSRYIAAHNVQRPDIWQVREVTLTDDQKLTPVLIGIWDSGVDISLFSGQVFSDPHPTASGTHGLAYDDVGNPSPSWLYPLSPAQEQRYPGFRDDLKGSLDLRNGVDSPEAAVLREKVKTSTPEQLRDLRELNKVIGYYVHGTHVAGIAVRGNPAARLVVARFDDQLPDLPFPPTAEWAHRMAADFQQMSNYFRTRNVRVVNMSWGDDPQEFELWLSKTGGGADPVARKRSADELYSIWRAAVESAIKNAPNTLFVCAAGNADSDASFLQDAPAGLHLPNLLAVGAVNQAGEETSFTSYGSTVVADANGYEVESFVPGGAKLRLSGTSMASPNVVNLAGKLFALDPSLTPAQVIELIEKGATTSQDGRLHLIDPKRSVELLQARNANVAGAAPTPTH